MTEPIATVLTREQQQSLTPERVFELLQAGNDRFVDGDVTHRDHQAQVRLVATGQFPKAVVLSCLDSRIPVEDVFDCGIGDIFVARVAGNFVNADILGSMEFACQLSLAKLIVVLGHEDCGAIKGAIDLPAVPEELVNLRTMLTTLRPSVDAIAGFEGTRTGTNLEFLHLVAEDNVRRTMRRIREESTTLRALELAKTIQIVGAMYEMATGRVTFLES
jgi:carbonic anhydrase